MRDLDVDILEQLLIKGFFPIQLPPNFTSEDFGKKHKEINKEINKIIRSNKKENPFNKWRKTDKHSVARSSYSRRTTNILNPISYFGLAKLISESWNEINDHYNKSALSLSKPIIDGKSIRAITLTKFSQLYEKKIIDSSGYKYALITDISSYFPSIYTHSISWALHSKAQSKENVKNKQKKLGDNIDEMCRNAQEGQTIGLPIGSDTSHIISELIGTAIDIELIAELGDKPAGFRYVDDFILFFSSRVKAEKALAILTSIISNYELEINASKTKIIETKELIEESWRYSVKKLAISHERKKQRDDIHNYFSSIFSLEKKYKDESLAKYSMKQLNSIIIKKDNWNILESYLLKVAYSFPNTIEIISRMLVTYNYYGYDLTSENIKRFINSMLSEHSNSSHHNEVCWLLWLAKELKIEITKKNITNIYSMGSSVCILIVLDMISKKIIRRSYFPIAERGKYAFSEKLNQSNWLVTYEAGKRKWLGNRNINFIKESKDFNILLSHNISFYDENAKVPLLFTIKNDALDDVDRLFESDEYISNHFEFNELDEEYFDNGDDDDDDGDSIANILAELDDLI